MWPTRYSRRIRLCTYLSLKPVPLLCRYNVHYHLGLLRVHHDVMLVLVPSQKLKLFTKKPDYIVMYFFVFLCQVPVLALLLFATYCFFLKKK